MLNFFWDTSAARHVSTRVTTYKILNINNLPNTVVEGVSKCDFAMSRDVACRVSMSATMYKIFNINDLFSQTVETQNFASLLPH